MRKVGLGLLLGLLAAVSFAQGWNASYEAGLSAVRSQKWADARAAFKLAAASRMEDASAATILPGPVSERRQWRNGAPYSPNFLAAYAGVKAAMVLTGDDRTNLLKEASAEFEALIGKNQLSPESFYFLNMIYGELGMTEKRMELEKKFQESQNNLKWRVDREGMTPEDVAAVTQTQPQGTATNPSTPPAANTGPQPISSPNTGPAPVAGRVAALPTKFALLVGNSESKLPGVDVGYANDDVQAVRASLVQDAGYAEGNVEMVMNGTRDQVMATAKALAERVPVGGSVVIYYVGPGANVDGKDYLAGVDTTSANDVGTMVPKLELYQVFMAKEARIFAFFQTNRNIERGRYFGSEVPLFGRVAQMQATIPGGPLLTTTRGGKQIGIFSDAFIATLAEMRTNQNAITEFGWQLFYKMRGGSSGGGGAQTPTLPVLVQLSSDSPF
jgi:hypothetical protein